MEEVDNILVKFVILMIQDDNEVDILFLEVHKMQCQCNRRPNTSNLACSRFFVKY